MHFKIIWGFLLLFTFFCKKKNNKLDYKPTLVFKKEKEMETTICPQTVAKVTLKFLKRKCEKGISKKEAKSGKSFVIKTSNSMLKEQLATLLYAFFFYF